MASKLATTLGVAVGSAALLGLPPGTQAAPVSDTEPNNSFASPQAAAPGDIVTGHVDNLPTTPDPVDFFGYSGLQAGSFFDVFVQLTDSPPDSNLFANVSASDLTQLDFEAILTVGGTAHLTGIVPADGKLVVGMTVANQSNIADFEDYRFTLTTRAAVPVPASLALVAAGLVGLGGLHVARRKKAA
jgi:hypothetical protein